MKANTELVLLDLLVLPLALVLELTLVRRKVMVAIVKERLLLTNK